MTHPAVPMLTAQQVADALGLSRRAVYDLADAGLLPCYRMGVGRGALRFDPADVEAYRAACRSTATNAPADGCSNSTIASTANALASVAFSPERWFTKLQLVGVDRVSQMAVAASELARADARWTDGIDPERIGVFIGSGMGGAAALEDGYEAARSGRRVSPLTVPRVMGSSAVSEISMLYGCMGPTFAVTSACSSAGRTRRRSSHRDRRRGTPGG